MAAADRVAGGHPHHRLWQTTDLDGGSVRCVEAPDARALGEVAGVAAHALVAAGAERDGSTCPGEIASGSSAREISTIVRGRECVADLGDA